MILFVHLLFGAAIGNIISNPFLAILLAFLGHYLLDFIPHIDYSIENIVKKQWSKAIPDFIKVAIDIILGLLAIFFLSKNHPIIYVCAFFGILPDGLSLLNRLVDINIFKKHAELHQGKLHFFGDKRHKPEDIRYHKKISRFWRIFSQVAGCCYSGNSY